MVVGERVRHRKYGIGTIKAIYPKISGARVLYDSGHETTNAQRKLQVLTAGQGVTQEPKRKETMQPVKRRGSGSSTVNYDLIERAVAAAKDRHPEADEIVGRWYGSRSYVEIWTGGRASIEFHDDG